MVSVDVNHAQVTTGNFLDLDDIKIHPVSVSTSGSGTLEITTISDAVTEASGSITATIKAETDRTKVITYAVDENDDLATVAISDNDTAGLPSVTISGPQNIEEGETLTFTLTANPPNTSDLEVRVRISQEGDFLSRDVSSNNEFDFIILANGTPPGQQEFPEATVADDLPEGNGFITLRVLSDPGTNDTYSVGQNSTIRTEVRDDDDDNLPSITITKTSDVIEGSDAVFTLSASDKGDADSVSVRVEVSEVGNFLANTASIRTVSVPVGGSNNLTESTEADPYDEENGSITAKILPDTDGSRDYSFGALSESTATIQVTDDDNPPNMSISVANFTERDDLTNTTNMVFTVEIDEESHKEISVNFTTASAEGTATSGNDFIAQSGTLTFSKRVISNTGEVTAGTTSKTINVPIYGDVLDEENETVIVTLSNEQNATLATEETTETGTITDNDALPAISIADAKGLEGTATDGSVSFDITLTPVSGRPVMVTATTSTALSDNATSSEASRSSD